MKIKAFKLLSAVLALIIMAVSLSSCSIKDVLNKDKDVPESVSVKTDLKDAVFSYTYGELKQIIPADKLAEIFSEFDELNDEVTVELSYNDITTNFAEDTDEYKNMIALLTDEEKAQLTDNADEVLAYFVEKINSVKTEKPIVKYSEGFWTDKDKIEFTQNGEESDSKIDKAARYFEYFVTNGVGNYLNDEKNGKKGETKQGDDLTDIIYLYGEDKACLLSPENVESVISSVLYDKQKVGDETVITGATRIIKITLKNDEDSVKKAFSLRGKDKVLDEMKKASDYFTVDDYSVEYNGCVITATFNAVTDNILSATYDKNMIINTDVTGVGSLEHIGVQHLKFNCTDRVDYQFGWAQEAE